MTPYLNLSGKSGVTAYQTGTRFIDVKFVDGRIYRYSDRTAGSEHIKKMKALALSGRGLSSYISRFVKDRYE